MNPIQNMIERETTGSRLCIAFSQPGLSRKRVISNLNDAKLGFHDGQIKQLEMTSSEENIVHP